jgi:cytochrome c553
MAEPLLAAPAPPSTRSYRWVAAPLLAFALFALTAGLLAHHAPRSKGYFRLFFSDPIHLKAGFATGAVILGCFQVFSAAWIFRKLPWPKPRWVNPAHRWSGRLAFVFTLPVAYHCIFKLGFRTPDSRVLAHSLLGCAVYGAYASKVTIVRLHRFPRPVLPIAGGMLFAVLIAVWYTSALWLYRHDNAPPAKLGTSTPIVVPADANVAAGEQVFTRSCGICHTLAAAKTTGQAGPNLDRVQVTFADARAQIENGGGGMPPFKSTLSPAQIRDVAAFVATHAGR